MSSKNSNITVLKTNYGALSFYILTAYLCRNILRLHTLPTSCVTSIFRLLIIPNCHMDCIMSFFRNATKNVDGPHKSNDFLFKLIELLPQYDFLLSNFFSQWRNAHGSARNMTFLLHRKIRAWAHSERQR